jgi:hypothetical protein
MESSVGVAQPEMKVKCLHVFKGKGSGFSIAALIRVQPPDHHRFTMWQTTGSNDGGVRRQAATSGKLASPDPLIHAARLTSRRPRSRTKDFNPQPRLVPVY